jgi:hypothetical protein
MQLEQLSVRGLLRHDKPRHLQLMASQLKTGEIALLRVRVLTLEKQIKRAQNIFSRCGPLLS